MLASLDAIASYQEGLWAMTSAPVIAMQHQRAVHLPVFRDMQSMQCSDIQHSDAWWHVYCAMHRAQRRRRRLGKALENITSTGVQCSYCSQS